VIPTAAADGATVTVTATRARTEVARVYNLTVADEHTYYVLAGGTPVLVHNDGGIGDRFRNWRYSRPGYSNYVLINAEGEIYYSGMFGPKDTQAGVERRHGANNDRFSKANGDRMEVLEGRRTYGEARLTEQRVAEANKTIIGRGADTYRGNRQNPLAANKVAKYEAYEKSLGTGGGC
jgi:hypothetical protein